MLTLDAFDLDELASALAEQDSFDHHWLLNTATGALEYWSLDDGGDTEDEITGPDLVEIEPIPSREWHVDMADYADRVSDVGMRRLLAAALEGPGSFRRFRDALWDTPHEAAWNEWRDVRSRRRAVQWLIDEELVDAESARAYIAEHPDPAVP